MHRKAYFFHQIIAIGLIFSVTCSFAACIKGIQPLPNKVQLESNELTRLPHFQNIKLRDNRKEKFIRFVGAIVKSENQRIEKTRKRIQNFKENFQRNPLTISDLNFLRSIAEQYRIRPAFNADQISVDLFNTLLVHVNIIPQSLAIAQASLESGWGTSRFAQEANNLFGVWCYTPSCGLVPQQRLATASHEVARFDTPQESVRQYMQLLNSHPAYKSFRQTRNTYHEQQLSLHGCILARELKNYSELREEYIDRLLQVIRVNKLERPDLLENECRSEQVVKR